MKKNILLGLMLISAVPAFSADGGENGGLAAAARPGGIRGWVATILPMKYVTHQTVYATAGGCGAYTAAHCAGSSDGWLGWIGLGGLCGGLYLGNRHYQSAERELGGLQVTANRVPGLEDNVATLTTENGVLEGQRDTAVGEFRDSINTIKASTGLHAITFLGTAHTSNESSKLLLQAAAGDGAEARAAHIDLLTRQQAAFVATGQFMLATDGGDIGPEVRRALPLEFSPTPGQ